MFGATGASAEEHPHRFATFSLFDPITTTQDRNTISNFRLAVIESHLHGVHGLDLVGISSTLSGDVSGLQAVGIYSQIGGNAKGIILAGFASHVDGEFRGIQASGIANLTDGPGRGIQLAGVLNFSESEFRGFQGSLALNMNDSHGAGWQFASVANVTNGNFTGLQTSTFTNFCNHDLVGAQIGGLNWARDFQGTQVGIINLADHSGGLQLGVVNVANEQEGLPVGLVNFSRSGSTNWMTWASNYMGVATGMRTRVGSWYSILSIGTAYTPDTDLNVVSLGWDYGYRFDLSGPWSISVDLGYLHLMPEKNSTTNDRLRPAVQARAFVERNVGPVLSVHAGMGATYEWAAYESGAETSTDPLYFAGISLFGSRR